MGFRLRKSVKLAPGLRLNLSPKSIGVSTGIQGARVSASTARGVTTSVGIPGSGISYVQTHGTTHRQGQAATTTTPPAVLYVLSLVIPPLAVLLCGKPWQAALNVLLTLMFWLPGVIHAFIVVRGQQSG